MSEIGVANIERAARGGNIVQMRKTRKEKRYTGSAGG